MAGRVFRNYPGKEGGGGGDENECVKNEYECVKNEHECVKDEDDWVENEMS